MNPKKFDEPYTEIVDDFLVNQKESSITQWWKWVKPKGVEYSESEYGKLWNLPYESPALLKIEEKHGRIRIIDGGWIDDNGNILSIKDMLIANKDLLKNGVDFNPEELYFVNTTNSVAEKKYSGEKAQLVRQYTPDKALEMFGHTPSQSAFKVKANTLDGYTEEEQEKMLGQLANFKIIPQSRDRWVNGAKGLGTEKCDTQGKNCTKYIPIYELFGYDTPQDFITAWKAREVENEARGEIGVALSMIITNHIHQLTLIPKTDIADIAKKYNINSSRVDRVAGIMKKYYINPRDSYTYSRDAAYYPTNVRKTLHGTKIQTGLNITAINNKNYDKVMLVDGAIGKDTRDMAEEYNIWSENIEYDKNKNISPNTNVQTKFDEEVEKWSKNLLKIYENNKHKKHIELSLEDEKLLYYSMISNNDAMWNAYRTIGYFLDKTKQELLREQLDTSFLAFKEHWKRKQFLDLLKKYSSSVNINEYFWKKSNDFLSQLVQNQVLVWNITQQHWWVPYIYKKAENIENEQNTYWRATTNLYNDYIEQQNQE